MRPNLWAGNIFEKRLIETYITENGTDPVTGEELTLEDLLDLKAAPVARPRPPTQTSIPALLATFQSEWDALALETFTLKQQLARTRQELSAALYEHEAAVRVVARVTRERDEARDALARVGVGAGSSSGATAAEGDEMAVDKQGLPEDVVERIQATQARYGLAFHLGWGEERITNNFD
jgi:pre-mRNA-processing factor 19